MLSGRSADRSGDSVLQTDFDKDAYLAAFPDVSVAVEMGHCSSAFAHYLEHGFDEGRLAKDAYQSVLAHRQTLFFPLHNVDQVLVTESGFILVEGWMDDEVAPLGAIRLLHGDRFVAGTAKASRNRRLDVESIENIDPGQRVGFWALLRDPLRTVIDEVAVSLSAGAYRRVATITATIVSLEAIRRRVLFLIGAARRGGMSTPELALQLEGSPADMIGLIGAELFDRHVAGALCSRFGDHSAPISTSIIVRLRQSPEPVFLQAALFSASVESRRSELIYVLDDAALGEQVLREASASARIYGLVVKVVFLPGRVGYGSAIDAAVGFAAGDRLLIVDAQLFPRRPDWLDAHAAILSSRPVEETAIFGAIPWVDGQPSRQTVEIVIEDSLAPHAARTQGVSLLSIARRQRWMPLGGVQPRSRPVASLQGHFISLDRALFERIGGFGHAYWSREMALADFCLRCKTGNVSPREYDLPLAYLPVAETPATPEEEAADLLDRCLLTRTWLDAVRADCAVPTDRAPASLHTLPVAPREDEGRVSVAAAPRREPRRTEDHQPMPAKA